MKAHPVTNLNQFKKGSHAHMVKLLAKYLKPFWLSVVFAVLLLFGQAFSDLSLPHYMSDIVNVGIQQGGISESTPKAISAKALSFLKVFMTRRRKRSY